MLNNGSKESKRKMGEELTGAVSVEQSGRQNFGQYQTEENIKVDGLFQLGAVYLRFINPREVCMTVEFLA